MSTYENAIRKNQASVGMSAFMKKNAIVMALIVLIIAFAFLTDFVFIMPRNLSNLLMQMSVVGVMSLGMTLLLVTGHMDMSVGSVIGFTSLMISKLVTDMNWPLLPALLLILLCGMAIGLAQGYLVAYRKLPFFIVTLAGMIIFRGATQLIAGSRRIAIRDDFFLNIGSGYIPKNIGYIIGCVVVAILFITLIRKTKTYQNDLYVKFSASKELVKTIILSVCIFLFIFLMNLYMGVPIISIFLIVLTLVFSFILTRTRFGRHIYAIGGNPEAANISGINVQKNIVICFVITGLLTAFAGFMLAARTGQSNNTVGTLYEIDVISACIIGGVSIAGGRGKISNAIIGTLLVICLSNGMSMLAIDTLLQYIVRGLVFIAAVWFDVKLNTKSALD